MAVSTDEMRISYPLPGYRFNVDFGGENIAFSEVSGLEVERQAITYRDGLGAKHMPGMEQPVKLTLKRGIFRGEAFFYTWINSVMLNNVNKRDIIISLLDDESKPVVTWNVQNAFPVKLSAPSLDAKSNEVALETLELMADSFQVVYSS